MRFTVRYRLETETEIANAFLWLEQQRERLGLRFMLELDVLDAQLTENPKQFQVVEQPDVRRALFRRFQYALFYRIVGDEVDVLACFHQHQTPRSRRELLSRI